MLAVAPKPVPFPASVRPVLPEDRYYDEEGLCSCCLAAGYPPLLRVPHEAADPLQHARFCVVGLVAVSSLRGCAVNVYNMPSGLHWTAHMLSVAADAISIVGASPVFTLTTLSAIVEHRCLGSLLTLLLTAALCDLGAAIIFFSTAGGSFWILMGPATAADEGAPSSVAFIGVWECILTSSNVLQAALCVSAWRFYSAFREAGIYPPDAEGVRVHKEVSPLELICEAEDVALLSDHCASCHSTTCEEHSRPLSREPPPLVMLSALTEPLPPYPVVGFRGSFPVGSTAIAECGIMDEDGSKRECWSL